MWRLDVNFACLLILICWYKGLENIKSMRKHKLNLLKIYQTQNPIRQFSQNDPLFSCDYFHFVSVVLFLSSFPGLLLGQLSTLLEKKQSEEIKIDTIVWEKLFDRSGDLKNVIYRESLTLDLIMQSILFFHGVKNFFDLCCLKWSIFLNFRSVNSMETN